MALLTVYVAWGATYPAIRVLGETVPPLLGMGARFLLAGLLLFAALGIWDRRRLVAAWRQQLRAAAAGVWILGDIGLIAWAEQHVEAGLAALVIASVPLWVILLRVATRHRPLHRELVAVAFGFAGLVVLLRPGSSTVAIGWMLLLILAAVIEASGQMTSQHLDQPADALTATAWQLTGAGLALLTAGAALGEIDRVDPSSFTSETAWAFAFLVVPGSLVAYAAFVWLLATSPIQLVASYAYVNPVVAVALGWALLDERVDAITVLGAGLVLVSVLFALRTQLAPKAQPIQGGSATSGSPELARTDE